MRISILYNKQSGCDYHRLLLPSYYMRLGLTDLISYYTHDELLTNPAVVDCDILFTSRMLNYDYTLLKPLKDKHAFKLVIDIDDYYMLPANHLYFNDWNKHQIPGRIKQAITNADYVFTTNEQLYNIYKPLNTNISIIPNALPFDVEPFVPHATRSQLTRFIYVAGSSHYNDIKTIRGALQRLGSDSQFKTLGQLVLCGYENPENNRMNIWYSIENIARLSNSYLRRNSLPLLTYMEHYNHGDVAIAPLENSFFNECKSNLKFVEAACTRKPFIATRMLPYTKDISNKGIIYCSNAKDWYNAFKFFINNTAAIEDYGNINYEYAKQLYNLDDANTLRLNIFQSLITK